MKTLLSLLLLTGMGAACADDNLLQNGDFSDGIAHWYGNVKSPDTVLGPGAESGAIIELRPHEWTMATQEFTAKSGTYKLHVTFTLSDGTHFSKELTDYINIPVQLKFADEKPLDAEPGQWVVVATKSSATQDPLTWTVNAHSVAGPQSYTFTIDSTSSTDTQTLLLGFPPGHGTVTLLHVGLADK